MCYLQRRHLRHPTSRPEIRRRHGPHHHPLLHLVRRWSRSSFLTSHALVHQVWHSTFSWIYFDTGAFHCFEKRIGITIIARKPAFVDTADTKNRNVFLLFFSFSGLLAVFFVSSLSPHLCISYVHETGSAQAVPWAFFIVFSDWDLSTCFN